MRVDTSPPQRDKRLFTRRVGLICLLASAFCMHIGRLIVILFIATAVISIAAGVWLSVSGKDEAYFNQSVLGLREIHEKAERWAWRHEHRYPDHVARLLVWVSITPHNFADPRQLDDGVWVLDGVDVRELPLRDPDDAPPQEAAATLNAAIDTVIAQMDRGEAYRFGEYFFAPLAQPHEHDGLVFGWTVPDDEGRRFVYFDSGRVKRIERPAWESVWERDARARQETGERSITMPAW